MPDQERIRELERRNREPEMENAFLKKAAAYAGDLCQVPVSSSVSRIFR
jgi:transposase-like protein